MGKCCSFSNTYFSGRVSLNLKSESGFDFEVIHYSNLNFIIFLVAPAILNCLDFQASEFHFEKYFNLKIF